MIKDELLRLLDAYPNFTPRNPTGQLDTYQRHLGDIPDWLLTRAVDAHIRSSKFFPSVAELREHAERIANTDNLSMAHEPGELPPYNNATYWAAMGMFNASLAGEVTESALYHDPNWIVVSGRREAGK